MTVTKEEIGILLHALKQYIHGESILDNEKVSVEISVENRSSSLLFMKTNYVVPKLSDFSCSCKKCSQFAVFMKHELSSSDF